MSLSLGSVSVSSTEMIEPEHKTDLNMKSALNLLIFPPKFLKQFSFAQKKSCHIVSLQPEPSAANEPIFSTLTER